MYIWHWRVIERDGEEMLRVKNIFDISLMTSSYHKFTPQASILFNSAEFKNEGIEQNS